MKEGFIVSDDEDSEERARRRQERRKRRREEREEEEAGLDEEDLDLIGEANPEIERQATSEVLNLYLIFFTSLTFPSPSSNA